MVVNYSNREEVWNEKQWVLYSYKELTVKWFCLFRCSWKVLINGLTIERKDEKALNTENPRRVIAQNKEFIQRLISSIGTGSDAKTKAEIISLFECLPVNLSLKKELINQISSIKDQVGTP